MHTPWGDEDSPTLVTEAETALEMQAVRRHHARRRQATDPHAEAGDMLNGSREPPTASRPAARRGCSWSRSTGPNWRKVGRISVWSASGRCSRAVRGTLTLTSSSSPGASTSRSTSNPVDGSSIERTDRERRRQQQPSPPRRTAPPPGSPQVPPTSPVRLRRGSSRARGRSSPRCAANAPDAPTPGSPASPRPR